MGSTPAVPGGRLRPFCALGTDGLALLRRYPFPVVFSSCSRKDLEASLEKGMGVCLFNLPEVQPSFGGQKCGNGYVEEGEECDCGEPEVRDTFPAHPPRIRGWAKKPAPEGVTAEGKH